MVSPHRHTEKLDGFSFSLISNMLTVRDGIILRLLRQKKRRFISPDLPHLISLGGREKNDVGPKKKKKSCCNAFEGDKIRMMTVRRMQADTGCLSTGGNWR